MRHKRFALCVGAALALLVMVVHSAGPNEVVLQWDTLVSGGGDSISADYRLVSSVGGLAPGVVSGAAYRVQGGFLAGSQMPGQYRVYLPLVFTEP